MLTLTKKTDYALVALSYLAKRTGEIVSARELGKLSQIPLPILTNILKTLAQAGIVVSERGSSGGYSLAEPASRIDLHKLITAIEGPVQFVQCAASEAETGKAKCDLASGCPVRLPANRIHGRLKEFLESVTLAELLEDDETPVPALAALDKEGFDTQGTAPRETAR